MVSGTALPDGDPFLQRQNEPSIAVSSRNSLHLLAGANDYRTVDLPFIAGNTDEKGDAWLGVYKSVDGGQTWSSNLVPGYPQDTSPNGLISPLKGLAAASDPVVRAGTNGLFYYSGMAFDRNMNKGDFEPGKIFVATFIDDNNQDNANAIQYLNTVVVDQGDPQHFVDKGWLAVDVPRAGAATCVIGSQSFPGGNVYVAYARFDATLQHSQIMFSRSSDCGAHWSTPLGASPGGFADQGATIAIDPTNGTVYLAWRRVNMAGFDSLFVAKSTDGGQTFSQPAQIPGIVAFDLPDSVISFRSLAYPTMAVDSASRLYLAWSAKGFGAVSANDARIVLTTSKDGVTWTTAQVVDSFAGRGHQFMPSLTYAAGKLMLVYYDSRDDHLIEVENGTVDSLVDIGTVYPPSDLTTNIFNNTITDGPITGTMYRRHTIDVRVTEAVQADFPQFAPSVLVSEYLMGADAGAVANTSSGLVRQLRFNVPDLPLFAQGNTAFIGDYIDVAAAPSMVPTMVGTRTVWRFNTTPSNSTAFHAAWTDNRDVMPPPDRDWTTYTAPGLPSCVPGREGMRNQNVYTSRIAQGLVVGSPENSKPLATSGGQPIQRSFVVLVQNTTDQPRQFQLTIPASSQPPGGQASFLQFSQVTQLVTTVPARSTAAKTVFVSSTAVHAPVTINVVEATAAGSLGLRGTVVLNPDLTNPDPVNPDPTNSEIVTPDLTNGTPRIVTPDLTNTTILTPDLTNQGTANFDPTNPDLTNLGIPTPDLTNADTINPDLTNPDLTNQTIAAGQVSDATWTLTNTGDTAASYSIKFLVKEAIPSGFKFQLLVYKVYTTPVAKDCQVIENAHNILLNNIVGPALLATHSNLGNPDLTNPDLTNATVAVAPNDQIQITLRILNPDRTNPVNNAFNPATALALVATAHAANTGTTQPPAVASSLVIFTPGLPDGVQNVAYAAALQAIGKNIAGNVTWTTSQPFPPGLSLNSATGQITGIPTATGTFAFTVTASDQAFPPHSDSQSVTIRIAPPLVLGAIALPPPTVGTPYVAQLTVGGGTSPFKWTITAGTLPNGLVLSTGGKITGTPTVPGHFTFTVQVTDSANPAQMQTQVVNVDVATSAAFTGWTQLAPAGTPPDPRTDSSAIYDPANNRMVVFGGNDTGCTFSPSLNDTWLLLNANGGGGTPQWAQMTPAGPLPPVRRGATAVYNVSSNRMILFGGDPVGCAVDKYNDVWVLTNANGLGGSPTWINLTPTGGPPPKRSDHTAVYDVVNDRMIIFGGFGPSGNLSDVWALTHADGLGGQPQWLQLSPTAGPPSATGLMSAVYDPASNHMTVFGGWNCCSAASATNELWVLTNANGLGGSPQWIKLPAAGVSPSSRFGHQAIYDAARKQMTIFGGETSTGQVNEVWTLANANSIVGTPLWSRLTPPGPAPAPRGGSVADPTAVYDPLSKRLLIFGGSTPTGLANDLWVIPIP